MAKKRHMSERVISKLREAEMAIAEGITVAEAARRKSVTEQTFSRAFCAATVYPHTSSQLVNPQSSS